MKNENQDISINTGFDRIMLPETRQETGLVKLNITIGVPDRPRVNNTHVTNIGRRHIPARVRWRVLEKAAGKCQICGRDINRDDVVLQIDHIKPVAEGGNNDEANLRAVCSLCNAGKGKESVAQRADCDRK